jgi:prepilin-type N-terminal cleavage/methylation domain-containing protein
MKKNSGFTLIEILITLAIGALLVGMALPNITNLIVKNRLENQIRRIYSDLMNARNMAMLKNRTHFVVFAANAWTVFADTDNNDTHDGGDTIVLTRSAVDLVPSFSFSTNVPQNAVVVENVGGWIGFNARGIARTGNEPNGTTISVTAPPNIFTYVDCISVSPVMMRLGKLTGGACASR